MAYVAIVHMSDMQARYMNAVLVLRSAVITLTVCACNHIVDLCVSTKFYIGLNSKFQVMAGFAVCMTQAVRFMCLVCGCEEGVFCLGYLLTTS